MIGKKVQSDKGSHMVAGAIRNLSAYITNPNNGKEKCIASGGENFLCDDLTGRQLEMEALAMMARSGNDPINHYVISWPMDEQPTPEQAQEAIGIIVDHMGISGCQYLWGMHQDTDNVHIHLMVNRIDPITERAVRINHGFDVDALQQAVALVEHKQGWSVEDNKRFAVMDDQIVQVESERSPVKQKVRDAEHRTGEKSAVRLAQEKALPVIQSANSWDELHAGLAKVGMQYRKKGSGAVIQVGEDLVKASDVSKSHASLSKVQKRLGEYQPPKEDLQIAQRPVEPIAGQTLQSIIDRRAAFAARKAAKAALDKQMQDERSAMFQQQRKRREDTLSGDWKGKGDLLNALRSTMAFEQAKERAELTERHRKLRKQFNAEYAINNPRQYVPVQSIAVGIEQQSQQSHDIRDYKPLTDGKAVSYVNANGMVDFIDNGKVVNFTNTKDDAAVLAGLQLSQQKFGKTLTLYGSDSFKQQAAKVAAENGITIANPELQAFIQQERERIKQERVKAMETEQQKQFKAYHDAVKADMYRVASRNEQSGKMWAMGKASDGTFPGYEPDKIPFGRIKELADKGTEHLYFTPLSKTHHLILIDDSSPEKVEQMQKDGIAVCYSQQSSDGNVQALVKIPRITPEPEPHLVAKTKSLEYVASVALAQELNKKYGDPLLANSVQMHRMIGTPNVKAKHRKPDGSYPMVSPIVTEGNVWNGGQERLKALMAEHQSEHKKQSAVQEKVKEISMRGGGNTIYDVHARTVREKIMKGNISDVSKVDAMVATMLRGTGHSQAEVQAIIESGTDRSGRQHDWADYARRTAAFAFSPKGTEKLQQTQGYHKQWQYAEKQALSKQVEASPHRGFGLGE